MRGGIGLQTKELILTIGLILSMIPFCLVHGAGTESGLILLRNSGARSSALGDAFTAMTNDITALEFNPASLASLESGHVSLQYERGLFEDTFSKIMAGKRTRSHGTFGLAVGHYNSGTANLFDGINPERSVIAEQGRIVNLGYGFRNRKFLLGTNIKYIWSELAETNSDSAFSAEVGFQVQLSRHLRMGAAGPLYQSQLQYVRAEEDLPSLIRTGFNWAGALPLATGKLPLQLLLDVPYDANQHKVSLALGAETQIKDLAIRLGYNTRSEIQQFVMGAGFQFMQMSLDYSLGLVANENAGPFHKINFSLRFNDLRKDSVRLSQKTSGPASKNERLVLEVKQETSSSNSKFKSAVPTQNATYQVYEVQEGETLQSISLKRYGPNVNYLDIFSVNRHLYSSPEEIKPGSKILLPTDQGS
ncbi:MAG: hypothetical protein KCHDKBKB_02831 [Elusimicrobia bacterium]|nr:hypothetical protein [Elusimicrobiota bacterium]